MGGRVEQDSWHRVDSFNLRREENLAESAVKEGNADLEVQLALKPEPKPDDEADTYSEDGDAADNGGVLGVASLIHGGAEETLLSGNVLGGHFDNVRR